MEKVALIPDSVLDAEAFFTPIRNWLSSFQDE